jgi:hypothetical protein
VTFIIGKFPKMAIAYMGMAEEPTQDGMSAILLQSN